MTARFDQRRILWILRIVLNFRKWVIARMTFHGYRRLRVSLWWFLRALSLSLSLSDDKSDSSVNIQTIASRLFAESAGRDQQLDLSDGLVDNIRTFAMQTLPEAFPLIPENAKYRKATKWFDPTISKSQHRSKVFVRSVSLWEAKRKTSSQRPSEASETRQLWKSAQFRLRQNFKFIQNYA